VTAWPRSVGETREPGGEAARPEPRARRPLDVWFAVTLLFAASVAGPVWPAPVTISLILTSGGLLFFRWARRITGDRRLVYVVCGAYAIRSMAALFLFVVSAYELPVFRQLQLGQGFWSFALDASGYQTYSLAMLRYGVCTGWMLVESPLDLFGAGVAALYWLFVPHPLVGVAFNVWAATGMVLLVFGLARRLGGSDATGVAAAALVAFWPSTLLWSTQLLREPGLLFILFLAFSLVGRRYWLAPGRVLRAGILLAGLAGTVLLLAKSRPYAGWIMLGAFTLVAVVSFAWRRGRGALVWSGVALVLGVWAGTARPLWLPITALPFRPVGAASGFACLGMLPPSASQGPLVALPQMSLDALARMRRGFALSGGTLRADAHVDITTLRALIRQLPETVAAALFAPYPWRWFAGATTGAFRSLAAIEVVLVVALLPALAIGSARMIRTGSFVAAFMLVHGSVMWLLVALVAVNEGTLFRLRLQGMLPVMVVGIAGGGLGVYGDLAKRIGSFLRTLRHGRDVLR
jgi:hypothetical protein